MAYDEQLAERFRKALRGHDNISEKKMMGGLCLFANGNMIGGVDRDGDGAGRFMFRVGKANIGRAEQLPGGEIVILGERRMPAFYFVSEEACDDHALTRWAGLALEHALSLPPK